MSNFKKMRQFCTVGNDNFRNKSFKKVQDMVPNIRNFKLKWSFLEKTGCYISMETTLKR